MTGLPDTKLRKWLQAVTRSFNDIRQSILRIRVLNQVAGIGPRVYRGTTGGGCDPWTD